MIPAALASPLVPNLGDVEHPDIPENIGIVLQMTFRDKAFNGKTSRAFPCRGQGGTTLGIHTCLKWEVT